MVAKVGGNYELVGATSWGRGCAWHSLPGIYADIRRTQKPLNMNTGLGQKAGPRFGGLYSCCCSPLLPGLACRILATWDPPFS